MEGLRGVLQPVIDPHNLPEPIRYRVLASAAEVAAETVRLILEVAELSIAKRGAFKLVLAGGSTPLAAYCQLAKVDADWAHWHIYHGDERTLPVGDAERNSTAAEEAWLNHVAIPPEQIHNIPTERGTAAAAQAYAQNIVDVMPFDLVLLGMGEDGHTASLFPGHEHDEEQLTHAIYNSPKPPPERVSLSRKALENTHQLLIIVTGAGKQQAMQQWCWGEPLPVASIQPACGVDLWLDRAALGG